MTCRGMTGKTNRHPISCMTFQCSLNEPPYKNKLVVIKYIIILKCFTRSCIKSSVFYEKVVRDRET